MEQNLKNNIILVGFMGCGKSTLGKELAIKFSMDFVDMDGLIEKQEKKSITQIFRDHGEGYFRELETKLLHSFKNQKNLVISTGGGTPCFNDNMTIINSLGQSVYIDLPPKVLRNRLQHEKSVRPLIAELSSDELLSFIEHKLEERLPFYQKSTVVFDPQSEDLPAL